MQTIQAKDLKNKIERDQDFVFLNVLYEQAFEKEHIPGSQNIPQDQNDFVQKVGQEVPEKDAEIIVYCASHECPASQQAAEKLEQAGYTNVKDFEGGMEAWKASEYEVAA